MIRIAIDALSALLSPGMTVFIPGASAEPSATASARENALTTICVVADILGRCEQHPVQYRFPRFT